MRPTHSTDARRDSRDIATGTLVNAAGVAASLLTFLLYLLLGRLYGAAALGMYLLAWSAMDTASKVSILGLDRAILSKVASCHADNDLPGVYRLLLHALLLGGAASAIVTTLLLATAHLAATRFFQKPALGETLAIMTWGAPFWTLSAVCIHMTRAMRIMKYEIIAKRAAEPLTLLVGASLAWSFDLGQAGLSYGFVASTMVGAGLSVIFLNRELPLRALARTTCSPRELIDLLRFSLPIGVYDLLNQVIGRIDLFLVGRYLPTAMAGVYGVAQETASSFKKVRQAFDPILIPVIAVAHASGDRRNLQIQYDYVTRWVLAINLALAGVAILAGPLILSAFGEGFGEGAVVLGLLAAAVLINTSFGIAELFILVDRPLLNVANSLAAAVVSAGLNVTLIPRFGVNGAALASVLVYAGMNLARVGEVWFLYRLKVDIPDLLRIATLAVVSLGVGVLIADPRSSPVPALEALAAFVFVSLYSLGLIVMRYGGLSFFRRSDLQR